MASLISSLSLKAYLNPLVYRRNIFGSSSKVFCNLREFSDILGNFRAFSENVPGTLVWPRNNFGKSSEIFGKLFEIFGKSSKRRHQYVYIIKRTLHYEFNVLGARTISHTFAALTREILFLPLEHKIHIFSPPCNILYLNLGYLIADTLYKIPHPSGYILVESKASELLAKF